MSNTNLSAASDPAITGGDRWSRQPHVVAQKITVGDLKALLTKTLIVEEGTSGMLLHDGRYQADLGPGAHTVATVSQRIKDLFFGSPFSAVLVDVSQQRLEVDCPHLLSRDNQEVNTKATLVLTLSDLHAFHLNVMKGASRVTSDEVIGLFRPKVLAVLARVVREATVADIDLHRDELGERLHDELEAALASQFRDIGLTYLRLDLVEFSCPVQDKLSQARGRLDLQTAELELRQRQREIQQHIDAEATDDRIAEIRTKDQFEEFVQQSQYDRREADRQRGARAAELEAQRGFEAKKTDLGRQQLWASLWSDFETAQDKRAHIKRARELENLVEISGLQHRYDELALRQRHGLEGEQLAHDLELARQRHQAKLDEGFRDYEAKREQALADAKLRSDTADIDRGIATKDAEAQLAKQTARVTLAMQLAEQLSKQELSEADAKQALALKAKEADARLAREQADAEHEREMARIRTLDGVKKETLMAVAAPEQAAVIAELLKTEALKGLSTEQVLALEAAKSPAAAQALIAKYQADGVIGAEKAQFYERMLAQQFAATEQTLELNRMHIELTHQSHANALATQRDTAVAAATGRAVVLLAAPQTLAPAAPHPSATPNSGNAPATVMTYCPNCGRPVNPSDKFSGCCGVKLT
ncbi:MAG: SPFH domain-containing protein [Planctomycetaceae bacterium]